jgi:radical S-adenosyl methionine domain-containing protein 2
MHATLGAPIVLPILRRKNKHLKRVWRFNERCISLCRHIKGKGMTLKINSVISQLNYKEDLNSFIRAAAPDKWKALKIKEFRNAGFDNSSLIIDDAQFDSFIERHRSIRNQARYAA